MRIIGITGLKRSGKNTVGEIIRNTNPQLNVKLIGFADKVKIAAARSIGFTEDEGTLIKLMDDAKEHWQFEGQRYTSTGELHHTFSFTGRQFLQWFGTETGRKTFGDTFWIDQVLPNGPVGTLDTAYPGVDILVITDMRFDNEAEAVLDNGGEVWEVTRGDQIVGEGDTHASEQGVRDDLITLRLFNDGSLLDLQDEVTACLR